MTRTISVTDHGDPIAEIRANRQQRWVPAGEVDALLRDLGADHDFARDITLVRAAISAVGRSI